MIGRMPRYIDVKVVRLCCEGFKFGNRNFEFEPNGHQVSIFVEFCSDSSQRARRGIHSDIAAAENANKFSGGICVQTDANTLTER